MFGNVTGDTTIKNETDTLGGSQLLDSGLQDMVIELAYGDKSAGGALSLNLRLKGANGESLNKAIYVTSGNAKGCLNYWVDKQGNKQYLPGYNLANAVCLLTVGKELSQVVPETKTVNIFDYELKKEVPKQREVLMELIGQKITLGVVKQIVDKKQKNDVGVYTPTGETREENEIDKIFRHSDGMTVVEIRAEATEAAFKERWAEKNTGVTRDKSTGAKATQGTTNATPAQTTSAPLFTN